MKALFVVMVHSRKSAHATGKEHPVLPSNALDYATHLDLKGTQGLSRNSARAEMSSPSRSQHQSLGELAREWSRVQ